MKLIRCVVHPSQLNEIFDMLQEFDISSLTVTAGRERCREQHQRLYYRGCEYKLRFMPVSVIEVTAPNHEVDELRWCSLDVAGTLLTYEHDRALLRHVAEGFRSTS